MKTYLEPEDVEKLEEAATNLRDMLLIRMLFWTGCRVSEALGIRVEDIDFDQATVTIKHLKARVTLYCPKCGVRLSRAAKFCPGCGSSVPEPVRKEQESHKMRAIPLDTATLALAKEFITRDKLRRDKLKAEDKNQGLIFRISVTQAWRVVRDAAKKVGIEGLVAPESGRVRGVSPHRLRDAFAVMAVKADDSTDGVRMLQEQLGHASIATTMRYRKVEGQELRQWYSRLTHKGSQED